MATAVPVFLQLFWSVFILRKRNRPQLRLVGNDVPTVDIFITCCGEDVDLVLDTTRATCEIDYPQDRFRVIILDDANCTDLRQAIGHLEEVYPNLVYRCRPKFPGVPHHFKAGNLNYGIQEVLSMPGGASQYVAALDADMIPEPHWLRAVMPHLVRDPKMALACPPQVSIYLLSIAFILLIKLPALLQCSSQ
jgi:cellulose synthase/poly-beta-1,6-N-acetylglucosamine synthase-like glycosyltransferase